MEEVKKQIAVEEHNLSVAAAVVLLTFIADSWIPLAKRKNVEPFPRQNSCPEKSSQTN